MTARRLKDPWITFRLGDPQGKYEIYSGEGAAKVGGRWNIIGQPVIYTSRNYSGAVLEVLAYFQDMPPNQHYIKITLPTGTSYEVVTKDLLPGWQDEDRAVSSQFGSQWFIEQRAALLIVPSVVAREDTSVIINPYHDDAAHITASIESPVIWDDRLFGA